jgi:uncharacterized protein (TIGR02246 family)
MTYWLALGNSEATQVTSSSPISTHTGSEAQSLHHELLSAWNGRDAAAMASLFADDGSMVGFDGSQANGPVAIEQHLAPVFASHPTAAFVAIVREVRTLVDGAQLLRAVAGMVKPGEAAVNATTNAVQSLVAVRTDAGWRVALFQNTPAAFHGRPEESAHLTAELQAKFEKDGVAR